MTTNGFSGSESWGLDLFGRAEAAYQHGQYGTAKKLYHAVLDEQPRHAEANRKLGLICFKEGKKEGLNYFKAALKCAPTEAKYWMSCIRALIVAGHKQQAAHLLEIAIERGIATQDTYALKEKLSADENSNRIDDTKEPGIKEQLHLVKMFQARRFEDALSGAEEFIRRWPSSKSGWLIKGGCLRELYRPSEAVEAFSQANLLFPEDVGVCIHLGRTLIEVKRFEDAESVIMRALEFRPDNAMAKELMGRVKIAQGCQEEAICFLREALQDCSSAELFGHIGSDFLEIGLLDEAQQAFRESLSLNNSLADAHFAWSQILLHRSCWKEGFAKYEWRLKKPDVDAAALKRVTGQFWRGESLRGKSILVIQEQGMGDAFQFVRYLPMLLAEGAKVYLPVRAKIHRILKESTKDCVVLLPTQRPSKVDYHIPLASIPHALGDRFDPLGSAVPYLFAEPERMALWAPRLPQEGLRIGINWQGSPSFKGDATRSIPLAAFAPLARARPDATFVVLQKYHGLEQLPDAPAGMRLLTLEDRDTDGNEFVDTAAVMASLDLVITSDTAVANLAGAMGLKAWVALKAVPDWRYGLSGETTPWYPTLRLFRQARAGDWASVFEPMAEALRVYRVADEPL